MKRLRFLTMIAVFTALFASCDKISVSSGETEQALTPVLLPSTTPIAGNDDNSNNDANNEIEVPIETVTPVREIVEFVEASWYDPIEEFWHRGQYINTITEEIKIYYNREGYYEAKIAGVWYQVQDSYLEGWDYVIRVSYDKHWHFNARTF